jgi:TrkA-N domain/RyR domain
MSPSADRSAAAAPRADRQPLAPGTPAPLLGWARGHTEPRRVLVPLWLRIALAVTATLALGSWGFLELAASPRLDLLQSLYAAVKLYTLDLGPASGSGSPRPDWQIWLALVAAGALVLRGVLALARDRVRRAAVRHRLSGHVIVCGAGVHGTRLTRTLSADHDVVLIDSDPVSPGMQELRGRYEWRLIGDAVSERTLRAAGVARAHWVIAVTGNDFVNSQIVSALRSLCGSGDARDGVHVLVQVEDPSLARFLEEEAEGGPAAPASAAAAAAAAAAKRPVVSPFSANAIAAETLLDESQVRLDDGESLGPLVSMRDGAAPNLLLVGDHPLIDALILAALRRWRVRTLRELESGTGRVHPPIHISVYGPAAERRVMRLRERWRPEPSVLTLEGRDSAPPAEAGDGFDDWLRKPDRGEHAIVACANELDGIALTLSVARALGDRARMTRVTTQFENALDAYVEERTADSHALATTEVKSIADLGARPEQMGELPAITRLIDALEHEHEHEPADPQAGARARALFALPGLGLRSDTTWRIRPTERPLVTGALALEPPLTGVAPSALMRAGLRVDLEVGHNLRRAAQLLTARGDPAALTACCEYLRHGGVAGGVAGGSSDLAVLGVLRLAAAIAGDAAARRDLGAGPGALAGAGRVTIFAGAAASMSALARRRLEPLLERALIGHDGVILCGGTAVGVPGIVGRVAQRRGVRLIGYTPTGLGDPDLYEEIHETAGATEFSVLEPVAMWTEIVRAGVDPRRVRLVACPGGAITIQEIVLARALGARVGWLDPAGDAAQALDDMLPLGAAGVVELPADAMTIRAFIAPTRLADPLRETVARYLHNDYRRAQRQRKGYADPALARWDELPVALRWSNLAQADDIPNKLSLIGGRLAQPGRPLELTEDQIELLAEVEHGRWNAERLATGWRFGPRQVGHSTSPDLVPWAELADGVRDYDREAVRNLGPALADAGWGVDDEPPRSAGHT